MPADDRTASIDWLRDRDAACPSCRYNLRGLTEPRCPECGSSISLSLTSNLSSSSAIWVGLAVAVCGSAGLGLIFAAIAFQAGWPEGNKVSLKPVMMFYICMIYMPWPLLRWRRRFERSRRSLQWTITIVASLAYLVALGIVCAEVR